MSVMHSQSEFIQNRVKDKKNHEAGAFNLKKNEKLIQSREHKRTSHVSICCII
jgi:hypothetical protein